MIPLLYLFPVFLMLMIVSAIFVRLDQPKGKVIRIIVLAVSFIVVVSNEMIVHFHSQEIKALEQQIRDSQDWKTGQIASTNTLLSSLTNTIQSEKEKLAHLATLGWSFNNPHFQEALEADIARRELFAATPAAEHPVVIQNLPSAIDKMLVAFTLEEMGFIVSAQQVQGGYLDGEEETEQQGTANDQEDNSEIEVSEAVTVAEGAAPIETATNDTANLVKPQGVTDEVNVLYFGHLVRNNDIKLILYTLLRAGVEIRAVRSFREATDENARQVRFGFSSVYSQRLPYTVQKIKLTKLFKR